jgi:hypothetical protein
MNLKCLRLDPDYSIWRDLAPSKTVILCLGILVYLLIAMWRVDLPGPQYDELLFVDAAYSNNPELFIHKKFHGIPILLMPYIGALKAWIYNPIFSLNGVTIYSIRVPMILLGILTLILYFRVLSKFVKSNLLLFISFLLICSDPAFSFVSRIDWGPNAIAHFLVALLLYLFTKYLESGSLKILIFILFFSLVGIFDKFNFLWFLSSASASAIVLYKSTLLAHLNKQRWASVSVITVAAFFFWIDGLLLGASVSNDNRN